MFTLNILNGVNTPFYYDVYIFVTKLLLLTGTNEMLVLINEETYEPSDSERVKPFKSPPPHPNESILELYLQI